MAMDLHVSELSAYCEVLNKFIVLGKLKNA